MKYYVTLAVNARAVIEVDADNIEEAVSEAENKFTEFDIGDLECVDADPVNVEDEYGNLTGC